MTESDYMAFPDVSAEEAIAAATAQAFTDEPEDGEEDDARTTVHSFAIVPGMMLGADWDLADLVDELRQAKEIKWCDHPMGHDLAVKTHDNRFLVFEVKRP